MPKAAPLPWFVRLYIAAIFVAGLVLVVQAVHTLTTTAFGYAWVWLALLALVSGRFSVKIPGCSVSLSIWETFIYALILMFGPAPATVTAAVAGLFTALHGRNLQARRVLFNFGEPALSTWIASATYAWFAGIPPLSQSPATLGTVLLPALGMSGVYFLSNSTLNTLPVSWESGIPAHRLWRKYFFWLSLNSFGGSSIAVLLAVNGAGLDWTVIGAVIPLLVISYLTFKSSMARVDDANAHVVQINNLYLSTVETLAMAIDAKDQVTHGHIRRVQTYAVGLARVLGVTDGTEIKAIEAAALLHDMGKLAVPEHILNKPGKLTPAEYERMKLHAPVGAEILSAIDFPYPVVPIVRHHHENWDGSGYPDRLEGEAIPIGARILAVVDCYDALTSDRPYRRALSDEEALAIVQERRGTMYDPRVVDAFAASYADLTPDDSSHSVSTLALAHVARTTQERHEAAPPVAADEGAAVRPRNVGAEVLRVCELSERLIGLVDVEDAGELIARHLRRLTPARLVVFFSLDKATGDLMVGHAAGEGADDVADLRIALGTGLSGWVAATRTTMVNSDPALDFMDRPVRAAGRLGSAIAVPIVSGSTLIGVMALYAVERDAFTSEMRDVVELIAREIAPMMERAADEPRGQMEAPRDPVTGFFDERYLTQVIESSPFTRGPLTQSLGVLSVTLPANSIAGHADVSVLGAAAAVRQAVRIADMAFRRGPRDIVVLMPNCDPGAGQAVVERLLMALAADESGAAAGGLEVGFACAPGQGTSAAVLVEAAHARAARVKPGWTGESDASESVFGVGTAAGRW